MRRALHAGSNAVRATIITAELLPVTNEGARYGSFAYAQTLTTNPLVGAAVLGGTTFIIEGASALAAAEWVAEDKVKGVIDTVDKKLAGSKLAWMSPKKYIPENVHVSPVAEAGIGLTFGTFAVLEAKQLENPTRTTSQNVKRGLFTAGWLSAVFAAEGALLSNGIDNYQNHAAVGGALLGIAGLSGFTSWAKKRWQHRDGAQGESQ